MNSKSFKNILPVFILILLLVFPPAVVLAEQIGPATSVLKVGFTARVFPDVDQRDAKIAMDLWARELAHGMGYRTAPQTVIYNNSIELLNSVKRGELTFVTLTALEYLQIRDRAPMSPVVVAANSAGNGRQFVIVARRDSGIKTVADLRGKSILLPSSVRQEASHLWLDVLLLREGYRDRSAFFKQTKDFFSSSQAIMSVFFKKSDAALIRRGAFETSIALNPQIGNQLVIITKSKSLLGDVSCIPTMVDEKLKLKMEKTALHLHETVVGKQIFTLFQTDRVIPFSNSYLEGIMELIRERDRLTAKLARKR